MCVRYTWSIITVTLASTAPNLSSRPALKVASVASRWLHLAEVSSTLRMRNRSSCRRKTHFDIFFQLANLKCVRTYCRAHSECAVIPYYMHVHRISGPLSQMIPRMRIKLPVLFLLQLERFCIQWCIPLRKLSSPFTVYSD